MTPNVLYSLKLDTFGSAQAVAKWDEALNALHAFAALSGARPGDDVFKWLAKKQDELSRRVRAAEKKVLTRAE